MSFKHMVLKPRLKSDLFIRELSFYETASKSDPHSMRFPLTFLPEYHGSCTHANSCDYIALGDLTRTFERPAATAASGRTARRTRPRPKGGVKRHRARPAASRGCGSACTRPPPPPRPAVPQPATTHTDHRANQASFCMADAVSAAEAPLPEALAVTDAVATAVGRGAEPDVPSDVDERGAARHAHGRPLFRGVALQRREQLHPAVLQRRLRLELLPPWCWRRRLGRGGLRGRRRMGRCVPIAAAARATSGSHRLQTCASTRAVTCATWACRA